MTNLPDDIAMARSAILRLAGTWRPGIREDLDDAWAILDRIETDLTACRERVKELEDVVLGRCAHGVDLDREFCPDGCRG